MLNEFLPKKLSDAINKLNTDKLNEIRLRKNLPVIIKYDFNKYFINENGLTFDKSHAIMADDEVFKEIISAVTENSLYAHNEKLKNGYLISKNKVRIGVCGETVFNDGVKTIKNITSILIRVPHLIKGIANKIIKYLFIDNEFLCTLIVSPPGFGKTTLLKDLIRVLSNDYEILVIDERGELFEEEVSADYIRFSDKNYGFEKGVRVMSPEIIATDELITESDYISCNKIAKSGVKIIATAHGKSINEFTLSNLPFDRIILLNNLKNAGEIKAVYDRHNNIIYG